MIYRKTIIELMLSRGWKVTLEETSEHNILANCWHPDGPEFDILGLLQAPLEEILDDIEQEYCRTINDTRGDD